MRDLKREHPEGSSQVPGQTMQLHPFLPGGSGMPSQQQSQAQTQGGSSVHIDGDRNTVIIAPRQSQESSNSESNSQGFDDTEDNNYR